MRSIGVVATNLLTALKPKLQHAFCVRRRRVIGTAEFVVAQSITDNQTFGATSSVRPERILATHARAAVDTAMGQYCIDMRIQAVVCS